MFVRRQEGGFFSAKNDLINPHPGKKKKLLVRES